MKNQLLNLKMIALMCLMMVLGGANVWAADKITDVANIVSGGKYYIGATTSNKVDCYLKIKGSSISTGKQEEPTENISEATIFVLEKSESGWVIKFDGTTNFLALNTGKRGKLDVKSTPSTFKFENLGGLIYMTSQNCALRRNKDYSTKKFGTYSTGTNNAMLDVWLMPATPAKALTSLAISGEPEKKTYEEGKPFEPKGLVVTGTYDDNTTATITDGITWTMNPATLSLNDVSCSVTATIGGITSPAYNVTGLTVNEAKLPSTTDATFGPDWDKLFGTSYNGQIRSLKANKLELNGVSNGVKIKVTNGTSTNGYVKTNDFRLYGKYTITITAPKDVLLSEITMTSQTQNKDLKIEENKITSNVGSVKLDGEDLKWIGSSNEIQFKFSDKVSLSTIKVATKAATAEPTYTAQTLTLKATDGSYNYSTFSSDKVTFFPGDGGVFPLAVTVKGNIIEQDYNVFKEETVTIDSKTVKGWFVPANTGVMLMSDDADVTYYTVDNYTVAALTAGANMLKPAPANGGEFTAENGYKYYKLAYDNFDKKTGLGFYWGAENGGAFKVKAETAYLAVPKTIAASAKGFTLNGEATGIDGVNANVENGKAIYNLNGQRVASMAKPGLYIVNGKKVVRK